MLNNLEDGRFEKLSFLTGILRGLLDKPAEVSTGILAGSIFVLPLYVWIMVFVGTYSSIFVAGPFLLVSGVKRDWSAAAKKTAAGARP